MKDNRTTDIEQDLNFDEIENALKEILSEEKDNPGESIVYKLLTLGDILVSEIEYLEDLAAYTKYFKHLKEFIVQFAIPKVKSLNTKIFKLAIERITTDDDIWDARHNVIINAHNEGSVQVERYILFLEKVLSIKPDTPHLEDILNDLYQYEMPITHSDAERISSILNYPIPAYRGNFSLLPTKR